MILLLMPWITCNMESSNEVLKMYEFVNKLYIEIENENILLYPYVHEKVTNS